MRPNGNVVEAQWRYTSEIRNGDSFNVRMKNCNFKIKFSRTTKNSECIRVKGPKMWNDIPADIKLCKLNRCLHLIFFTKLYFCNRINLVNVSVLLVCNDYLICYAANV